MTLNELMQIGSGAGGGAVTTGVVSWYFFKKWMDRVDERFKAIEAAINKLAENANKLNTSIAVAQERQSNLTGRMDQMQRSIENTHKDIGKLAASVNKLWMTLKSANLAPIRDSDNAIPIDG